LLARRALLVRVDSRLNRLLRALPRSEFWKPLTSLELPGRREDWAESRSAVALTAPERLALRLASWAAVGVPFRNAAAIWFWANVRSCWLAALNCWLKS